MVEILARLDRLAAENAQLHETIRALENATPPQPEPIIASNVARRPVLPDPERFDGSDPKLYTAFERDIQAKFRLDGWQYPAPQDKADYIMSRLTGIAKKRADAWLEALERNNEKLVRHEDLLASLKSAYHDPEREKRAIDKLGTFKQGSQQIGAFLANFDVVLTEAGGTTWHDSVKINYLKRALKLDIVRGMLGTLEPEDYTEFCTLVRRIDNQLWQLKQKGGTSDTTWKPRYQTQSPVVDPDAMDWQRTIAAMTPEQVQVLAAFQKATMRTPKSKLSREERKRRRQLGLCFSCNESWAPGHRCFGRTPAEQGKSAKVIAITEENSDEESGKDQPHA